MSAKVRFPLALLSLVAVATPAMAKQPADLAGTWELSFDRTGATCRVMLRPQQSDKGDYFLGMPAACRHAMPALESVGHWALPDAGHLTLNDPTGSAVLTLAAAGESFMATAAEGTYLLKPVAGRPTEGFNTVDIAPVGGFASVQLVASKNAKAAEERETPSDLAGRYAVMREKRDTGCMLTLDDKSRVKGGERAQLAPGCRDQGIVIFDPAAWQIVKGDLVLTARAGHKAVLEKKQDGTWQKDAKAGGKPLGLKKL